MKDNKFLWEEEENMRRQEFIETHIFRQMRKQCQVELFEHIKNKKFDYEMFEIIEDYIYLTINSIIESFRYN